MVYQLNQEQTLFIDTLTEMLRIFISKNTDYGSSYSVDDVVGVVIRLGDKLHRLKTLSKNGFQIMVKEESLRDTLMDIANYSAIAIMLMQKKNGKKKSSRSSNKQKLVQQSQDHFTSETRFS